MHTYYVPGAILGPEEDAKKVGGHLYLQESQMQLEKRLMSNEQKSSQSVL